MNPLFDSSRKYLYPSAPHLSERAMVYGYDGAGWKNGNYYTSYISPNSKYYTKDKFYGKEIYTPFWNVMRS